MDIEKLRKDFPILNQKMRGKRLAYLDSAATSQKPKQVIDALVEYYEKYNSNVHRSIYKLSELATEAYENTRKVIANHINAYHTSEVLFTKNTNEAINLVANILAEQLRENDEILLTQMEHHANIVPWQMLAKRKNLKIKYLPIDEKGILRIDKETLAEFVNEKTKVFSFAHVSNVLGTISNPKQLIKTAKKINPDLITVVDGAQAVPHLKIDVKSYNCDFYTFTAHKMLGPMGVGVLWGRRELLEKLPPFMGGSDMILEVTFKGFSPNFLPYKYEVGTPNVAAVVALAESIKYLNSLGLAAIREHEIGLTQSLLNKLEDDQDIEIYGPKVMEFKSGVVSFNIKNIHAHDLASVLDTEGVAIRSGHHCAQPLVNQILKQPAVARASFYLYNSEEDIDQLIKGIQKAKKIFSV